MKAAAPPTFQFASVPRLLPDGGTVVCLGGGPSLTPADVDYCRGKALVIAINDAYKLAPWADVLYACDARWWNWHRGAPGFQGLKFSLQKAAAVWKVGVLKRTGDYGLETKPHAIRAGRNSGYQAINVALHLGASRILLLGYDMQFPQGGKSHWFGEHPNKQPPPVGSFRGAFRQLPPVLAGFKLTVINCSRETALNYFPRMTIDEALP